MLIILNPFTHTHTHTHTHTSMQSHTSRLVGHGCQAFQSKVRTEKVEGDHLKKNTPNPPPQKTERQGERERERERL